MPKETTTRVTDERILTLLYMLGSSGAETVLHSLESTVAERFRKQLQDTSRRPPTLKQQQRALEDFDRFFRFAASCGAPRLKLHEPRDTDDDPIGSYTLTGEDLRDLEGMNATQVTTALEEESPRTAAILLKSLSAERNADILSLMAESKRDAIVRELSLNPKAPEILVQQMARTLVARAAAVPPERVDEQNPIQRVAEVLRASPKPKRREMLATLKSQDPQIASQIQKLLYRFEDLAGLDDRQIRSVLSKVDTTTLSIALYECDEAILTKVTGNLARRARLTLEEEMSFLSYVSANQHENARNVVAEAIAEVEQEEE